MNLFNPSQNNLHLFLFEGTKAVEDVVFLLAVEFWLEFLE